MRLKPPVGEAEVLEWLQEQAIARWGPLTPEMEQSLASLAHAMAAISAAELPDEFEPHLV